MGLGIFWREEKGHVPDRWLYIPLAILLIAIACKMIELSQIISVYPLHFGVDLLSYLARLHFLKEYGYFGTAPNWYGGFQPLQHHGPAWFLFSLPFLYLTGNLMITGFLSIAFMLLMGFAFIYYFGRMHLESRTKRVALFAFLFASPIAVAWFIAQGRAPEMFAWTMFMPLFLLLYRYRDHPLDRKSIMIPVFYSLTLLGHPFVFILSSLYFVPMLLLKKSRERSIMFAYLMLTVMATSVWWVPYLASRGTLFEYKGLMVMLILNARNNIVENIYSTALGLAFILIIYLSWKSERRQRNFLYFFLPASITAALFATKALAFVPLMDNIYPDTYNIMLLFTSLFLLLRTPLSAYPKAARRPAFTLLLVITLAFLIAIFFYIGPFQISHTPEEDDFMELIPQIEGKFMIADVPAVPTHVRYSYNYLVYATVYHNFSTPSGWFEQGADRELVATILKFNADVRSENCSGLIGSLAALDATSVLGYDKTCRTMAECGLTEKAAKGRSCIYLFKQA